MSLEASYIIKVFVTQKTTELNMEVQQAFGHAGRVFGLAFHPIWGPNVLASASEDETVRVWCRSRPTDDWEQTSCCRGHQAEVLRVAWSPDGRLLASGSADQTVRLWQVGTQGQFSYSGQELAVLRNHPGEVYGLKFLNLPTYTTQLVPAQTQNGQQQQQQQQVALYDTLLTASGDSLFLWDLTAGKIIHQSAPLPVMSMLRKLQLSSNPAAAVAAAAATPAAVTNRATGVGFAPGALSGQQQQQQPGGSSSSSVGDVSSPAAAAVGNDIDDDDDVAPSYIFGIAAADATNWLSAVCSDGMLRLWDASRRTLQEIAAVKAHPSGIGSCCSFIPQQPWLLLSIAKSGQAVLQDIRMLGRPLLQQQLEGPVFDMAWTVRQVQQQQQQQPAAAAAAAEGGVAGAAAGSSSSNGHAELVLQVVGRDEFVRSYPFNQAALQAGALPDPDILHVSCSSYRGTLLSVAATLDGRTLAAAGEPVTVDTLKPRKTRQQQQQSQQQQQQQQQQDAGSNGAGDDGSSSSTQGQQPPPAAAAAAAVAPAAVAAAKRAAAAGRRKRSKGAAAAVDLFGMSDQDIAPDDEQQQQQQQQQTPAAAAVVEQPQATATDNVNPTAEQVEVERQLDALAASGVAAAAAAAAAASEGAAGSSSSSAAEDYSAIVESFAASVGVKVSDMPPEWAQMVAAAAAAGMLAHGPNAAAGAAAACPAADAGLTQAPLFTVSV